VDGDDVLVVFRGGEVEDGFLRDVGILMVATTQARVSLVDVEVQPKMRARWVMVVGVLPWFSGCRRGHDNDQLGEGKP
jgi:hypothetical protein